MPLLQALAPLLQAMTQISSDEGRPVAEMRAAMHEMIALSFTTLSEPEQPVDFERDFRIAGNHGEIPVRVYRSSPPPDGGVLPCHIYFHGGAFWLGTLEQADSMCRAISRDVGCTVVSVDYRLAPEFKFPIAIEESYAVLQWVIESAATLGIDPQRVSIGGASAGANIAAVVSLMAKDRAGPQIVFQILEIPVTDFTALGPLEILEEGLSIPSGKETYRKYYLSDPEREAAHPYASPLHAEDLTKLPPALVMCAEYDALQPEGLAFAQRLLAAGVETEYHCWPGQFHGSQSMSKLIPSEAAAYRATIAQALLKAYRHTDGAE